jgi:hypothetical protein
MVQYFNRLYLAALQIILTKNDMGETHIGEELLESYALGRVRDPELAQVEDHLLLCGSCRTRLDLLDHCVETMRAAMLSSRDVPPSQVANAGAGSEQD